MSKDQGCQARPSQSLKHPSFVPDPAASDFHLFGLLTKHLEGRNFRINAEILQAVLMWLHDLDVDFFYVGFDTLVFQWNKFFNNHNGSLKKLHVPVPY
ncbi:hypothetical protein AVEN_98939-1 [Araneus ventricosus]|uniref:Uncharacterized protein n=1 Tax=Araneus ventricosus TaxID=182803 RepID=A0A4Y2F631_ARAVE|nr:hypothetical protein AVEN_98939-1 [Araneus ventricosus]